MKTIRRALIFYTFTILSFQKTCPATTCVRLPSLKPIRRISGIVFAANGDRIANANVTVFRDNKKVGSQLTGNEGKFSFDSLPSGKYKLSVTAEGFQSASVPVILVRPRSEPREEIAVSLALTGCSAFSIVNPTKLESGLNPPKP